LNASSSSRRSFQHTPPSAVIDSVAVSGMTTLGVLSAPGRSSFKVCVSTGTVRMKPAADVPAATSVVLDRLTILPTEESIADAPRSVDRHIRWGRRRSPGA
jgi:hypothetical protein